MTDQHITSTKLRVNRRVFVASALVVISPSVALAKKRPVQRYTVKVPGSPIDGGGARGGVQAPDAIVSEVVTDFAAYARFIEKVRNSRVVARNQNSTDMYFEIPILHGLTKVWAVLRFAPARSEGSSRVIKGRMIKGNAKRLDITWRLQKLGDRSTQLTAELLLDMKFPAPDSMVLDTVRRAAHRAMTGAASEAERRFALRG
jgi:ribosome-associated toxin RatA of RatAB toxin-antitoxin module